MSQGFSSARAPSPRLAWRSFREGLWWYIPRRRLLLSTAGSGKINCVIVKDLSRFARNYSDAGSLIDNLFVQMGVRFISLAENVDSYLNPDSVSNIIVPITNVMKNTRRLGGVNN